MRKIILMIAAVLASITFAYAESCSSGQGSLSYQISGCGYQARACCSGTWCSWGTSTCASCTATSTTNSRNCSGNVSGACAGTQTQSCTRSVTGSCGSSCTYGSWSCGSWTGSCTYTQSCTATTQACSSNVSGACAGNRTRTVTGTCGSCSYSGWSNSGCSYTQSCTATTQACSGNVSGACAGNRTRTVTGTCGSCSYSGWSNSGCSYTQSCTATSTACSNVSSSYCKGTATRSVTGSCGSCSYGSWNTSGCTAYTYRGQEYVYASISATGQGLSKDDSYRPNDNTNYHPIHLTTSTGITLLAFLRNKIEYMEGKVACRTGITTGCCNKAFNATSYAYTFTNPTTVSHGYAITCAVYSTNRNLAFCYCPNYVPRADCV